ncbi:hypothetical protein [Taibaiella soli]|uniref:Uncharacterized protein n=1 Tax=Taibaiella soli TaxID=1649169 RepID=A0A2W2BCE3_9BACT|nr:hypothetical protein [Taibaiella soli]PZF73899.1 hypothetical protein DN068_06035 [Taibaiella soli]
MNITGYDYILFSQKSFFELETILISEIKKIWPKCVVDKESSIDNMLWLFFTKDNQAHDDDSSYELNENGEGSFSIIANKQKGFDATVAIFNDLKVTSAEVKIILENFWSYTIVLPGRIESNPFSNNIYQLLCHLLSNDVYVTRSENKNKILARPVQDFLGN